MHELTSEDVSGYKNFLRMDPEMFQELINKQVFLGRIIALEALRWLYGGDGAYTETAESIRKRRTLYGSYTAVTEAVRSNLSVNAPPKKLRTLNFLSR